MVSKKHDAAPEGLLRAGIPHPLPESGIGDKAKERRRGLAKTREQCTGALLLRTVSCEGESTAASRETRRT